MRASVLGEDFQRDMLGQGLGGRGKEEESGEEAEQTKKKVGKRQNCTPFAVRAPDLSVSKLRTGLANATLPTWKSKGHVRPKRCNLPYNYILACRHVVEQIRSRRISEDRCK